LLECLPVLLCQFGFIAYENEEGKNLFFHMSEVEGEVELQASLRFICVDSEDSLQQEACVFYAGIKLPADLTQVDVFFLMLIVFLLCSQGTKWNLLWFRTRRVVK